MKCKTVLLTPELAKRFLESAAPNRTLSDGRMRGLKQQMLDGKWKETGESIKFNLAGQLIDGQHRCWAVVESGVSISTLMVEGLKNNVCKVLDSGKSRTTEDRLSAAGFAHPRNLAVVLKLIWKWERDGLRSQGGYRAMGENDEALLTLHRRDAMNIDAAVEFTSQWDKHRAGYIVSRGMGSFVLYMARRYDRAKADLFITGLYTGENLSGDSVVLALRRRLTESRSSVHKLPTHIRLGLMIKAWNLFVVGKSAGCLKMSMEEEMPMFAGESK